MSEMLSRIEVGRSTVLADLVTDPNALSMPPHITGEQVKGFALAASKTVLSGGVGQMRELARAARLLTTRRNRPGPTTQGGSNTNCAIGSCAGARRRMTPSASPAECGFC